MTNERQDSKWEFRENSLDLIRLLAAMQVMVLHTFEFTMQELTGSLFFEALRLFPGVPVFFFISGYLITRSYERSPNLTAYFKNRILRIYPALIVCVLGNIVLIASTGYFKTVGASVIDIGLLFLAKTTILQFYNPDFMRSFGDGVLNGSLWTICVELQFYVITPIFYTIFKFLNSKRNLLLLMLILCFGIANRLLYLSQNDFSSYVIWKLFRVSFAPWFYIFMLGMLVQRNFNTLVRFFDSLSLVYVFLIYAVLSVALSSFGMHFGNSIPPYIVLPLSLLVFKMAYSKPLIYISSRLLKGNDISYGLYIWHMVFVNQLLFLRSNIMLFDVVLVLLLTASIAIISWFLIEKRALSLKKFTLLSS